MRVRILSRYSRLGASSRLRTMQYLPALEARGLVAEVRSLFDDAYLEGLYAGRRSGALVARRYLQRLRDLRRNPACDLIWLEKEALP